VRESIQREGLRRIAAQQFGDFVKAVVDVERGIMAIGGELHSDEEATLLEDGSVQTHLWGINLYPEASPDDWIEFDSAINLRPAEGNRTRGVERTDVRQAIKKIVSRLVQG
jgi:hypothetical protein